MSNLTGTITNLDIVSSVNEPLEIFTEITEHTEIISQLTPAVEVNVDLTPSAEIQVSIVGGGVPGPPGPPGSIYPIPETYSANNIIETTEKQFISMEDKSRISGYTHDQIKASKVWTVSHTLDKYPSVSIVDTGGSLVIGEVDYISTGMLTITFAAMFSGKAYLN